MDTAERTPIAKEPLSLVLTARPGDASTPLALQDWVTHLNGEGQDYEIWLAAEHKDVNAGKLAAGCARVQPLEASNHSGYGAALRAGLEQARRPLVFYGRCSGRFKPAALKPLLRAIDEVDLVLPVRQGHRPTLRERGGRFLAWLAFGLRLQDPAYSYVLARRALLERIPIQSDGAFAHLEILAKANFLGCLATEVELPVPASDDGPSEPTFADFKRVFQHPEFLAPR